MEIIKTSDFIRQLRKLPVGIRNLCDRQEEIFRRDQLDPRLHLKRIIILDGVYSFRITISYRCLFYFQSKDSAVFFAIGHRKDIYRC